MISLVEPAAVLLPGYRAALAAGWSPNTTRDVCAEQLAAIAADAEGFIRRQFWSPGDSIPAADGLVVPRLPGAIFWISDGAFCGSINLRYAPGSEALPPYVSGHVGYSIVPGKRRLGYATAALGLLLPVARRHGLRRVLVTCDPDNHASRRVIEANGGAARGLGDDGTLQFWIELSEEST